MHHRNRRPVARIASKTIAIIVTVLVTMTAIAVPSGAQTRAATSAELTGRVLSATGRPMPGVSVKLWPGVETAYRASTSTDDQGRFHVRAAAGRYIVTLTPTRTQMFDQFYYATVAGDLTMYTNDAQPAPGQIVIYLAFPSEDGYSAPRVELGAGRTSLGTVHLRQGAMMEGTYRCSRFDVQNGVDAIVTYSSGQSEFLPFDPDGHFATPTPRPAGSTTVEYGSDDNPCAVRTRRTTLAPRRLNTLPAVTTGGHNPAWLGPFTDVSTSNPHVMNIEWLRRHAITKPANDQYQPLNTVTRGSMAAFLFRLTNPGQPQPDCTASPFPDVSTSSPFCGYITWAKDHHIAFGYPDGHYGASHPVTRGAMAAYLYRIANPGRAAQACTAAPFSDVAVDSTFCGVISWAKDHHITYGVGGGTYGTTLPVTRQAMASFLHRIHDLL